MLPRSSAAAQASILARAPGIWVARLENKIRPARLSELCDVFARPARDLEDEAARWQVAPHHVEDRFPITSDRRYIKAGVFFHAPLVVSAGLAVKPATFAASRAVSIFFNLRSRFPALDAALPIGRHPIKGVPAVQ
jgi:hypothetical protein